MAAGQRVRGGGDQPQRDHRGHQRCQHGLARQHERRMPAASITMQGRLPVRCKDRTDAGLPGWPVHLAKFKLAGLRQAKRQRRARSSAGPEPTAPGHALDATDWLPYYGNHSVATYWRLSWVFLIASLLGQYTIPARHEMEALLKNEHKGRDDCHNRSRLE